MHYNHRTGSFYPMEDCTVVIPVVNESHEIVKTVTDQLKSFGAEVIVVDDGSGDPYPDAIKHGSNFGYGSALMTGIKNASNDIIITMDGDGQHTAEDAQNLYKVWKMLNVDMIIGTRRIKHENIIRFMGRKFLNSIGSLLALHWLQDLNSGQRIFRRSIAIGYFAILCKQFSFTTSLTMSMMCDGYKVEWFPISVRARASGKSRVKVLRDGWVTLYFILRLGLALRTRKIRGWVRNFRFLQ